MKNFNNGGAGNGPGMPHIDMPDPKKAKETAGKLLNVLTLVIVAFVAISFITSGIYRVSEQEQAVLTRFGKVQDVKTAGMYFKIPFIDSVHLVRTTTYGIPIGYKVVDENAGENGKAESLTEQSLMITSDFNFVNTDFYIEYRVSDPVSYLYNSSAPEAILENLAQAAIRTIVSNYNVDDVMTTSKNKVQSDVRDSLVSALTKANIGLEVVNVSIQDVEPPNQLVMSAFKSVENAKQGSETSINNANKYKSEQLPAAEANADKIEKDAEAKKEARIAEAEGQVARFNAMYDQYKLNPLITKQRLFYETMEDVLPDLKVIIDDGGTQTMLPLASFTSENRTNTVNYSETTDTDAYSSEDYLTEEESNS
ncbi:FtsH protease activity modulator HflK [Oribacterium sp. FC2011]|uniref:FtsH protease activity modulator HflK n=1 Tax=Oribacterium sp. FC2011 TaxID=1408311 RepID=UPI000ABE82C2|nr:FtsH protease activity modulator HflK [Oribacterium sp. FC2011]